MLETKWLRYVNNVCWLISIVCSSASKSHGGQKVHHTHTINSILPNMCFVFRTRIRWSTKSLVALIRLSISFYLDSASVCVFVSLMVVKRCTTRTPWIQYFLILCFVFPTRIRLSTKSLEALIFTDCSVGFGTEAHEILSIVVASV